MIRHPHRGITVRRTLSGSLVLTGAVFALVATGCGGGSSGGSGGSGGSTSNPDTGIKLDAPPATSDLPASGPELGPDTVAPPDVAVGGAGGTGGAGGVDGGGSDRGGSGGATSVDVGLETGSGGSAIDANDAGSPDVTPSSVDSGPFVCPTATHAWTYPAITTVTNIAWDKDGNLITGASAYSGTEFGGLPWTSAGSADAVVAKLNPNTGRAAWLFTAGDIKDQLVNGVAVTSASLGVVGSFTGTLDIDPINQNIPPIVNNGSSTVEYLMGLKDSDGTGVWSKKVDLKGGQFAAIAGNPNKDFFIVCGAAMNTAANLSAANLGLVGTPGGGKDVIVAAVNAADGTVKWAKLFGGSLDQACTSAALDDTGNAVFAGTYTGTLDFGAGALSPAPTDATAAIAWVAKFDGATGTFAAAKALGTTGRTVPYALTVDAQGNAIVAGGFNAQFAVGSQTLVPSSPTTDAFVVKLDSSLTPLWGRRWGGTQAVSWGAAADSTGRITVVGFFKVSADVGPGAAVMQANNPTNIESFIVTLDGSSGQTLCAKHHGDAVSVGGSFAQSIAINRRAIDANKDRTVIGGQFHYLIDFGGTTTPLAAAVGVGQGIASSLTEM